MAGRSVKRKVRRQKLLINFLVLLHAGVMFGINLMIPVAALSIFYAAMHFHGIVKMKCASKRIVISGILVAFVSVIVCHVKYGQSVSSTIFSNEISFTTCFVLRAFLYVTTPPMPSQKPIFTYSLASSTS